MKKWVIAVFLVASLLCLASCSGKEDVLHMGLNAEILAIDVESTVLEIRGLDQDSRLRERCSIDCTETPIIYCNYSNEDVREIAFTDLQVGDQIILAVYESELMDIQDGIIRVNQIQLGTQRLN